MLLVHGYSKVFHSHVLRFPQGLDVHKHVHNNQEKKSVALKKPVSKVFLVGKFHLLFGSQDVSILLVLANLVKVIIRIIMVIMIIMIIIFIMIIMLKISIKIS